MFNNGSQEYQSRTSSLFVVESSAVHGREILNSAVTAGVKTELFSSTAEFGRLWIGPKPGCVLLDLGRGNSGLQLQANLAKNHEYLCVIATGAVSTNTIFESSKLGAFGFIEDVRSASSLIPLVKSALTEADDRWSVWQRKLDYRKRLDSLTRREVEVFHLLIEGLNNKEMAGCLNIAVGTIEKHKSSVLHKVRAKNPAHLLSEAFAAMGTLRIDNPSTARPPATQRHSLYS